MLGIWQPGETGRERKIVAKKNWEKMWGKETEVTGLQVLEKKKKGVKKTREIEKAKERKGVKASRRVCKKTPNAERIKKSKG